MSEFLNACLAIKRLTLPLGAPVAVAVSGGSDSMALLQWADTLGERLHVLTVDHRLRPEAAQEAAFVKQATENLGHSHQTLVWNAPRNGQAHARAARHRLLARAARQAGAAVLLLGHTMDDVVETMAIRDARGVPGPWRAGPLPMSPSPVWPEGRQLVLMRPLLHRRRAALREGLRANGMDWVDDPSNDDQQYERARVRATLAADPARRADLMGRARDEIRAHFYRRVMLSFRLVAPYTHVSPDGLVTCALDRDDPDMVHILPELIRASAGHDRPVRRQAVETALAGMTAPGDRVTLGGAWLQATRDGLLVGRAPGEPYHIDAQALWDGRFMASQRGRLDEGEAAFLVRHAQPPGPGWSQVMTERLAFNRLVYEAPLPEAGD